MEKALDLKILQVFFKNRGENFSFLKNVEFLEFFGFTLCFRTFQAKKFFFKIFQTDRKISLPKYMDKLRDLAMKFFYQSEKF